MKKCRIALLLSLFVSIILTSCDKKEGSVFVYRPPATTISFSETTDLIIDSTGKTVNLKSKIDAKEGIQKIEVTYQPWNLSVTISSFSDPYTYQLNQPVTIPLSAALKIHSILIKVTDKKGGSNFTEVKIGLQDLNYAKLYMSDVADASALSNNLFGIPMVMDKTGSHTYQLIYYARQDNLKIRFLPNKKSFTPVAIGKDPENTSKLITDATKSLPIELGAKGYYKISVNLLLLTYTVEKVSAAGSAYSQVALVGRGFYDYPSMNWQNELPDIILLDKDATNPFLFTKLIKLGTPPGQSYTSAQFILTTNNGWTNFWRFDNGTSPELAVFNSGTNADIPISSTPITYLFVFDSYSGRVQAIKQ